MKVRAFKTVSFPGAFLKEGQTKEIPDVLRKEAEANPWVEILDEPKASPKKAPAKKAEPEDKPA